MPPQRPTPDILETEWDILEALWNEERNAKAVLRFGDRDHIVARARVEERLERAA